jgi:glucokinase
VDTRKIQGSIGIDIGGTKTLYVLFNDRFRAIAEERHQTYPDKGGLRAFNANLDATIGKLMRKARGERIEVAHVGIGCAGDIDRDNGVIRTSLNLGILQGYALGARLEKLTGARVYVANDVQAALYGEIARGAASRSRHVIGIWIGTGIGGAVAFDRRIFLGASGHAGDLGNYLLHAVDVSQEQARKDVLDNMASRTAIAGEAAALAASHRAPEIAKAAGTDLREIKAQVLAKAIRKGDKAVKKLVDSRASVIGAALSNFVDFLNPDMVVLGGGLVEAMPAIMQRQVSKAIVAHCKPEAAKAVKVRVAKFLGHAGAMGAVCLAKAVFSNEQPFIE